MKEDLVELIGTVGEMLEILDALNGVSEAKRALVESLPSAVDTYCD